MDCTAPSAAVGTHGPSPSTPPARRARRRAADDPRGRSRGRARAARDGRGPGGRIALNTNLLSRSGASAWAIDEYLAAHTSLPPLGAAFMAAERKYGVNARFLLAAALHESGWGSGYIARVKHNLFGYNAYDRDPVRFANAYRTYAANIDDTARFIKDFYLTPGGRWWGGRPTLRSMQRFWSSSGKWGTNVSRIARTIRLDSLRHRRLAFAPPVVSGPVHPGERVSVRLTWSGGRLPAKVRFVAVWVPVELDADVVAAAATPAAPGVAGVPGMAAMAGAAEAAIAPAAPGDPRPVTSRPDAAAAGGAGRGGAPRPERAALDHVSVPAPSQPGRYELRLELRDAGGWPLPAVDRVAIPGAEVRVWAARAVSYAIEPSPDGSRCRRPDHEHRARRRSPPRRRAAQPASSNPEVARPQSIITVTASADGGANADAHGAARRRRSGRTLRRASPSRSPPRGSPRRPAGRRAGCRRASACSATRHGSGPRPRAARGSTPRPGPWSRSRRPCRPRHPTPAPPVPTPKPTPTPVPTPTPAHRPKPPVTTIYSERSGAIRYRGGWADASGQRLRRRPRRLVRDARRDGDLHLHWLVGGLDRPGRAHPRPCPRADRRAGCRARSASGAPRSTRARSSTATGSGPRVGTPSRSRCSRRRATRWSRSTRSACGGRGRRARPGQLAGASASGSAASAGAGAGARRRHLGRGREVDGPDAPGAARLRADAGRRDDAAHDRLDDRGLTGVEARCPGS